MIKRSDRLANQLAELEPSEYVDVMDKATKLAPATTRAKDGLIHVFDLKATLEAVRASKGQMRGLPTGYKNLDKRMGGLEPGSVVILSGDTSTGKSAMATNIAARVAEKNPVLYISLEMSQKQMLERLDLIADDPNALDLTFQESFALSYRDLEPLLQKAKEKHSTKLVVLDYLQYLGRGMTNQEVAQMSKEIKSLALRYDICFLVIVSLRKGSAETKYRRRWTEVNNDDLMGTSAIAYDADVVLLTSRKDPEDEYQPDKIYLRVLKSRNTNLDFRDNIIELDWDKTKIIEKFIPVDKKRN